MRTGGNLGGRGLSMSTGDIETLYKAQQAQHRSNGGYFPGVGPLWNPQVNPYLDPCHKPLVLFIAPHRHRVLHVEPPDSPESESNPRPPLPPTHALDARLLHALGGRSSSTTAGALITYDV